MVRAWAVDIVNGSDANYAPAQTNKAITAASKANPCVVTVTGHSFADGDYVYLSGVGGMSQINNTYFYVKYVDANNVSLYSDKALTTPINSTAYTTYTSGGTMYSAVIRATECEVTCPAHGLVNGQFVYVTGTGMTQLATLVHQTSDVTATTFKLKDLNGNYINSTTYTPSATGTLTFTTYSLNITSITKANPAVVTCTRPNTLFANGDKVFISCEGMTQINKSIVTVANVSATGFECSGLDSSAFDTFTSGTVRKPYLLANTLNAIPTQILNEHISNTDNIVYFAKTFTDDSSIDVGSGNITWTAGSATITTSVDLRATIAAGNYIGLTSAVGTGCYFSGTANDPRTTKPEIYYKVISVGASSIVINSLYAGTTTTVSSISRLRTGTEIRTTGAASTTAITWTQTGSTIEGGYDFSGGVITRNGETWISCVTLGDYYDFTLSGTNCTVRYFGFVGNAYRATLNTGTNSVIEYCYACAASYYGYTLSGATSIIRYCSGTTLGANYGCFYSPSGTIEYCYGVGNTTTSGWWAFQSGGTNSLFRYCLAERQGTGFYGGANVGGIWVSCEARYCTYGYTMFNNAICQSIVCSNCTYGFANANQNKGILVQGYAFTACTYGFYVEQTGGGIIDTGTCTSCGRDFYIGSYVNDFVSTGHTSVTPVTYTYDVSVTGGISIANFSIDAPSIAKAFSARAAAWGYLKPCYTLQGCSQFADGQYYYAGDVYKDTADTYSGGAWSIKIAIASSGLYLGQQLPLFEVPVANGVGGTVTYRIKRHASFTGTLTPTFWIDGQQIETETVINHTDISDSTYTQFTATVSGGSIGHDGMLQFGFLHKGTVNPLNVDFLSGGFA